MRSDYLAAATFATTRRAFAVIASKRPSSIALASSSADPDADRDRAGADPVAGVVERDAAGRHQLHLRQRPAHVLDELRAERRRRKHLDDVGAALVRREDLGRREAAWHRRHVALVAGGDHLRLEHRADDERRAGIDHARARSPRRSRCRRRAGTRRQRRRQLADQLDRARHGHRHLERAHAAFHQRVDDRAQLRRILQADHRHDAERFDLRRDSGASGIGCRAHVVIAPSIRRRRPARVRGRSRPPCDARKTTAPPRSSGSPHRPAGMRRESAGSRRIVLQRRACCRSECIPARSR